MNRHISRVLLFILLIGFLQGAVMAQSQAVPPERIPLKVQIVISRYEGERILSSLPYMLQVMTGVSSSLSLGTRVPVRSTPTQPTSVQLVDIGTQIEVTVTPAENGRYRVQLRIVESSVLETLPAAIKDAVAISGQPAFRNFTYGAIVAVKEAETQQVVSSADKGTGETVKVDITVTAEK